MRERDRAAIGVFPDRARTATADDVTGVAGVTLTEDHVAGGEAPRSGVLGDASDLVAPQGGEHWDPGQ